MTDRLTTQEQRSLADEERARKWMSRGVRLAEHGRRYGHLDYWRQNTGDLAILIALTGEHGRITGE